MNGSTLPHWLNQRAHLTPERIALETDEKSLTFRELNDIARSVARKLRTVGVQSGSHVALLMRNSVDMVISYHALSYLKATAVPLNIRLTAEEQAWQLKDSAPALLLHDTSHETRADNLADQSGVKHCAFNNLLAYDEADVELVREVDMDDSHTMVYTSGTTGRPKGVILTHGNHWWSAVGSALNLGLVAEDKWLACVPLFHVSGLSILMRSVIYGMPVLLHERFSPGAVNDAIRQKGVTIVSVVSATLSRMVNELDAEGYPDQFRCMLLGGGPAPQPLLEQCRDLDIPVFQTYGLSETASQIVTLAPEYMLEKLGSAGKPLFPAQLKIITSQGGEAQPFEHGEIVVKGPNVTIGYYHRPDATKQSLQNGWLKTGDVGYLDTDGFLYVLDRRKDMIISGGENIYPAEIESVLTAHPNIEEAGVIGMEDNRWGQVPVAFVVQKGNHEGLGSQALTTFCQSHLASYKIPKKWVMVDELPRNASNKLLRRELQKLID
ncbi:o-succinylbenzoate--CoA ligase [Tuberibacillus sp. Marseille-P3662]|uniref:o-succinylbenzoate--CoA ligase n=1 Tax=Tuberibacillus sp. Marseille-P3662 TaxID=1965358 RepID=UPI000A1CB905|nr:o-succinylbenzoate--CoA ligase [Tuberibacillus sp. Marseille-P3662]